MKTFLIFISFISVLHLSSQWNDTSMKVLSRKRRYIVFPEGSSLQLVYCMTMPSLGMGKIFTIGSTVAMAWELPHEPIVFHDKKHQDSGKSKEEKPQDLQEIEHFEQFDTHQFLPENNYFSSDNADGFSYVHNADSFHPISKEIEKKYYNFNSYDFVAPEHYHVYRRTRRDLYGKLSKLIDALGANGRECIFKLICQVSQVAKRKGSFMEEMVKVIFRIKTHEKMSDEDDFDVAHNKNHNCAKRYKNCSFSFIDSVIPS